MSIMSILINENGNSDSHIDFDDDDDPCFRQNLYWILARWTWGYHITGKGILCRKTIFVASSPRRKLVGILIEIKWRLNLDARDTFVGAKRKMWLSAVHPPESLSLPRHHKHLFAAWSWWSQTFYFIWMQIKS